ncbi:MAG TPA: c-type cytochrome [Gemmatimonadales bacterium]|nr:c-type cytochrome [Gemmatimonadales bacterium]
MTRTLSATLTAVVLLAACGGERRADTATQAADSAVTAATPGAPGDSAAQAAPTTSAAADSGAAASTSPATPTDTGAKRPSSSKADGKKLAASEAVTAHRAAPAQSGQAKRDTARVKAEQDTAKAAAAATPQDTGKAAAQDTGKAAAPAGSTSTATAQADQPLRDAYHQPPKDTVDQATYDGWKQFNLNCARCHGEDVMGTTIAPHLILSLKPDGPINTKELFMQTVCAGRPAKGMPAWCALGLDMQKISDIYLYVKGRSDAKLSPGRPAVKGGG